MILKHFDTMPCSFCTGRKVTRQVILEAIMAPFATALYLIEFSFGPDSQDCYRSLDHLCVGLIVKFRDLLYLTTTYGSSSHRYFIRLHPSAREIIWQTPPPWRNWHSLQKTAVICGYFQIYSVELKIKNCFYDPAVDRSALYQVTAECHQDTRYYLNQV